MIDVRKIRKVIKSEGVFRAISRDKVIADDTGGTARFVIEVRCENHDYIVKYHFMSCDEIGYRYTNLPFGIYKISNGNVYSQLSAMKCKIDDIRSWLLKVCKPPMPVTPALYLEELMDALITASII